MCSDFFLQICTSMLWTKNLLLRTHLPHEFCLTTFSDLGSWFSLGNLILTLQGASKKLERTTNHNFNIHVIRIWLLFRPLYISYSCDRLNNSLYQLMRFIILCNFYFFLSTQAGKKPPHWHWYKRKLCGHMIHVWNKKHEKQTWIGQSHTWNRKFRSLYP